MAFEHVSDGLPGLVRETDSQNIIWRSLLQALHDHGGEPAHLNKLLQDTVQGRSLLNEFAKKVIGRIWELTEELVDLGLTPDHFEVAFVTFHKPYSRVSIGHHMDWRGALPTKPCRYKLIHFDQPMGGRQEILNADLGGSNVEHAGWRELVAYVGALKPADLCGCQIVAAGSLAAKLQDGEIVIDQKLPAFPGAAARGNYIEIDKRIMGDSTSMKYYGNYFYLVRVYGE